MKMKILTYKGIVKRYQDAIRNIAREEFEKRTFEIVSKIDAILYAIGLLASCIEKNGNNSYSSLRFREWVQTGDLPITKHIIEVLCKYSLELEESDNLYQSVYYGCRISSKDENSDLSYEA